MYENFLCVITDCHKIIAGPLKILANIYMILLMGNDVLAHSQIKDGYQRMSLPIVFILLLTCRLVIYYQEVQREKAAQQQQAEKKQQQQQKQESKSEASVDESLDQESKKTK